MRRPRHFRGPGRRLQTLRRSLQVTVLLLLFVIPSLSVYDNLRNQRDEVGIASRWDTRAIDGLVGDVEGSRRITQAVRGSVWTLKLGPLVISDPLAVADFIAASGVWFDAFVWTALIPVLLSLVLGRIYCGWICPADLLFEVSNRLRGWMRIRTDVRFARSLKYVVLGLGALAAILLGTQVFAAVYPPRVLSSELYLWITFGAFGAGAWFLLLIVTFEMFVSERFWCRYVCPGGALFSGLGRWRLLRLKLDSAACTECRLCNAVCEFGLDPMNGKMGAECNNCGLCVRSCTSRALVWRWGRPPRDGRDLVQLRACGHDGTARS
ncbi:MAG: 4Fe-4S binding protein [Acidobacteriota bacterium]